MSHNDDISRFTIRDRDADVEAIYQADADNLRVEKLSTRITLVAVLIPCLLVIVLAIAYMDIKNRVVSTQHTGSMGVQNLSKDLESRFSNLSLKQAKMEQRLDEMSKALETAGAGLQVNLKKATTEIARLDEEKLDRSMLANETKKMEASIAEVRKDIAELSGTFNRFDEELAGQIRVMAEGLKKDQGRLTEIETKTQQLDAQKINKASMDLALRLERIALQEMVKDRIRDVERTLTLLGRQIDTLDQRLEAQTRQAPPTQRSVVPMPSPPPAQSSPDTFGTDGIQEQTIN
ncbi:MAG: hypothetical protein WBY88_00395 [Desulfosarcina sp.]